MSRPVLHFNASWPAAWDASPSVGHVISFKKMQAANRRCHFDTSSENTA